MTSIDIITVCKNSQEQIKLNIKNVIEAQGKNKNINWIVIDGCSTDGTTEIIRSAQVERITHIISKDSGIYDAMNIGMSYSNSDFFIFLNAGDILLDFHPDLKEGHVNCFRTKWHSIAGDEVHKKTIYLPLIGKMMPHQGMFFYKDFKEYKYNQDLKISADMEIKYLALRIGCCVIKSEILVSSLVGGVSQIKLTPREYCRRIRENVVAQKKYANIATRLLTPVILAITLATRINLTTKTNSKL